MQKISKEKQTAILVLRLQGKSIPEIHREVNVGITTVQRYVKGVEVPTEFKKVLREKQGGSKERARGLRENSLEKAEKIVISMSERDRLFLLIGLYWGEGAKHDFSLINSDPLLLKTFIVCLQSLGIGQDRLSIAIRVHSNVAVEKAKKFWSKITGLKSTDIKYVEIIEGKKKGKLQYGMCRVRVKVGIKERLLLQSAITLIGKMSIQKVVFNR